MSFSLSGLLQRGVQDVQHVFNGATTPAPKQQAVATLPSPGQAGYGVMRPGAPVMQQPARPFGLGVPVHQQQPSMGLGHAVQQTGKGFGMGLEHVGLGLGQGLSGLADLVTPGTGQSRVTQGLNAASNHLNQQAKQLQGAAHNAYNIGNISGTIGSFLGPGEIAKAANMVPKVASGLEHIAPVINVGTKLMNPVTKAIQGINDRGTAGRITAAGLNGLASPAGILNTAGGTALQLGHMSGQGQQVTPGKVAGSAALNAAAAFALPAGARAIQEGAKAVTPAIKAVGTEMKAAANRTDTNAGLALQQNKLTQANKGLQSQADKLPVGHPAVEQILQKVDRNNGMIQQLESKKIAQTPIQKVTDRVLTAQPGLSMKPVKAADVPSTMPELPLPHEAAPVLQTPANTGRLSGDGVSPLNGSKQTKFTGTVKKSDQVSPEVKAQVNSSYIPGKNNETVGTAKEQITQQGLPNATNDTLNALNTERGTASRDTLAKAIEVAKQHDAIGTPESHATAANLLNLVAEHGSAKGQGAQILATIARSSPAGLRNKAINDLKKAGVTVTDAMQHEIQGHIDTIASMKDGPAKDMAIAVFQRAVSKHLPQSMVDKGISIWKAGLLSGVKTQQGNAISNGTFAALKKVSDVPATAVDKLLSLKTGQRTKSLTMGGSASGTKEGIKNAGITLKTGIDPRNIGDKYEQHAEINFGNKILQNVLAKPANAVFRGMSAADQPFWYSSLKNSLYDQAKADGRNKGLTGSALVDHIHKTVQNPTETMADVATNEANKSTLNYDTIGSKAIQSAHKGIDNAPGITKAGAKIAHGVLNVIAPFVRVPSAFISRTVDFTPLGVSKEVFHQIAGKSLNQRALSQAIGEGMTGTGVIAAGVMLSKKGQISGDYPKNDVKEQQRWKAEGITPNSVRVGNKWINLNYFGPVGLLFNAGHQITQAKGEDAMTKAGAAIGGLGQGLLGQSFLQGFTGFSDAIKDPNRNLKSFENSQAASIVPSLINDAANATDKFQRQADNVSQSIKNRIPGLRETNKVKQDVYGNPLKQPSGALNTLNGVKPSDSLTASNPAITEVNRLHGVNPNDSALQVTPTPVGKTITVDKNQIPLNADQRYALQNKVGQSTQSQWNTLIQTPAYKAMSDTQKAAALGNIKALATEDAQRQYVTDNKLGTYSKAESSKAIALRNGTNDVASLASSKATGGGSGVAVNSKIDPHSQKVLNEYNGLNADQRKGKAYNEPSYDYKVAQAKYDNAVANGTLSKAQQISQADGVRKAAIGQTFSKDTRDLYGLSKPELYNLITTDPNGKAIAADVLKYGDALQAAKIENNKFRTLRTGAEAFAPKTTVGQGAGKGASNAKIASSFTSRYSSGIKAQQSLRSIAAKASMGKTHSRAPKSSSPRLKNYKIANGTTVPRSRKAFA